MLNKFVLSTLFFLSSTAYAGTMGAENIDFSGFWVGAGGSYAYTTLSGSTHILKVYNSPSSSTYLLRDSIIHSLAPAVEAGYYYAIRDQWYIGPKLLYNYIGQEQFDLNWSGTYQDGSYQALTLRTKSIQNINLYLSSAYQFCHWLVHAGVGPGWAQVQVDLNGDLLPTAQTVFTPINQTQKAMLVGGAGQLGFAYMLPNRFKVDISYNFLATPTSAVPTIIFNSTKPGYSSFSQRVSVVEQSINITINKYFS